MTGNVRADVLFSNLGDGDTWDHTTAYVLEFRPAGKAMPFMASFTGSCTSVELPLGIVGGPNQFVVELRADDNGSPGEVLESFVVQDVPYRVELREIQGMRDMYRHEMNCQITKDSIHERPGWTHESSTEPALDQGLVPPRRGRLLINPSFVAYSMAS
jgi:hypothetical protein